MFKFLIAHILHFALVHEKRYELSYIFITSIETKKGIQIVKGVHEI